VIHLVICPEPEKVQSAGTPRDRRGRVGKGSAERLPTLCRGSPHPPILGVPGLVIHLVIYPEPEKVQPLSTPGDGCRGLFKGSAERLPTLCRGSPYTVILGVPGLVIHLVICPEPEKVQSAGTPRDRRGRVGKGSAERLPTLCRGSPHPPILGVPGLVIHLVICPESEQVQPIETPGGNRPSRYCAKQG